MPEATVYQCDKTEGLKGEHLKCGREVGDDGVEVVIRVISPGGQELVARELQFCRRTHANYWLVRQRVALEA